MKQIDRKSTREAPKPVKHIVAAGLNALENFFRGPEPAFAGAYNQVRPQRGFRGRNLPSTALGLQFDPGDDDHPWPIRLPSHGPPSEIVLDLVSRCVHISNIMVFAGSEQDKSGPIKINRTKELERLLKEEENPLLAAAIVLAIVAASKLENEDGFGILRQFQKDLGKLHATFEKARKNWDEQRFGPFDAAQAAFDETLRNAVEGYYQLDAEQVRDQAKKMCDDIYRNETKSIPRSRPGH